MTSYNTCRLEDLVKKHGIHAMYVFIEDKELSLRAVHYLSDGSLTSEEDAFKEIQLLARQGKIEIRVGGTVPDDLDIPIVRPETKIWDDTDTVQYYITPKGAIILKQCQTETLG